MTKAYNIHCNTQLNYKLDIMMQTLRNMNNKKASDGLFICFSFSVVQKGGFDKIQVGFLVPKSH